MAEKGVGPIIDRSRVSSNTKWKGVQINANILRFETSEHSEAFHISFIWATWSPHACLMVICSLRLKSASNVSHGARRIVALACIHFVELGK